MTASAEMTTIHIEDVIEGDRIDTTDYFFERIGESVPVKTPPFHFDLQNLPSQPLAVSDSHIFVALPSGGFCVARTEDVIALADEIEEKGSRSSIHEVSVVDVPLGEVRILALSSDNSTLAASLAQDIHFFSVNSLLRHKGHKPSFSCSLNESSHVKDLQWRKRSENSYLVLSNSGQLYHGTNEDPIKDVMDNVDAVEWSINGNYVAVARNNILTILSSKFKERVSLVLPFESLIGDSDVNSAVKAIQIAATTNPFPPRVVSHCQPTSSPNIIIGDISHCFWDNNDAVKVAAHFPNHLGSCNGMMYFGFTLEAKP